MKDRETEKERDRERETEKERQTRVTNWLSDGRIRNTFSAVFKHPT